MSHTLLKPQATSHHQPLLLEPEGWMWDRAKTGNPDFRNSEDPDKASKWSRTWFIPSTQGIFQGKQNKQNSYHRSGWLHIFSVTWCPFLIFANHVSAFTHLPACPHDYRAWTQVLCTSPAFWAFIQHCGNTDMVSIAASASQHFGTQFMIPNLHRPTYRLTERNINEYR